MRLLIQDGVQFFGENDKLRIATEYYRALLGHPSPSLPTVDLSQLYGSADLGALEEPFTWAEIATAIKKSPNNRSPGPDGFTNEFYKCFKEVLKEDLMRLFQEFYELGSNFHGINVANVVLIPKKEAPTDIRDFRPISLVHSLPKLITKVLAARLQRLIPAMIHPLQLGFLPGRCIIENFMLAAELVQQGAKRKKPMIVLKLDFRKAFDSVSWDALFQIFQARGFGSRWNHWISNIFTSSSSQVLLNGQIGEKIQSKCGLRQGGCTVTLSFHTSC